MSTTSPPDVRRLCAHADARADDLAALTDAERGAMLRTLGTALTDAADEIVTVADDETHLGRARLSGELDRTARQLNLYADVIAEGFHLDAMIDPPDGVRPDVRHILVPVGPVAVFSASNFPLAFSVAGTDTASALAAGCPVVVKAHEGHPRLSALVAEIATSVLPDGALSIVYGREAGRHLVQDPAIAAVAFTGSLAGGRALHDLAASRRDPIPFYGELGSINPVVVTPAAAGSRLPSIVDGFVASFTLGQGQFCTKPGLLFLPAGHGGEELLRQGVQRVAAAPLLGDWVTDGYARALATLRGHAGVRELVVQEPPGPTLLTMPASAFDAEAAAECFGPASLIVEYGSDDELRRALSVIEGSLTVTLHGELPQDADLASGLVGWARRRAGRIIWNGWPTGVAVTWAMQHGGPWPASTSLHTSVGAGAVRRFLRPLAYQDVPQELLPTLLRDGPAGIPRRVAGRLEGPAVSTADLR